MKLTHVAALAAISAGCAGAFAGEFQSALVGKVRYDDVPGWTD